MEYSVTFKTKIHHVLRWRHNGCDSVSNHQPHHCLLNRLFRRRSKETSKLRVTGLCVGNSPGTGEFSAQMASNAENVSIWWRHHGILYGMFDITLTSWHTFVYVHNVDWIQAALKSRMISFKCHKRQMRIASINCVNKLGNTKKKNTPYLELCGV